MDDGAKRPPFNQLRGIYAPYIIVSAALEEKREEVPDKMMRDPLSLAEMAAVRVLGSEPLIDLAHRSRRWLR